MSDPGPSPRFTSGSTHFASRNCCPVTRESGDAYVHIALARSTVGGVTALGD